MIKFIKLEDGDYLNIDCIKSFGIDYFIIFDESNSSKYTEKYYVYCMITNIEYQEGDKIRFIIKRFKKIDTNDPEKNEDKRIAQLYLDNLMEEINK